MKSKKSVDGGVVVKKLPSGNFSCKMDYVDFDQLIICTEDYVATSKLTSTVANYSQMIAALPILIITEWYKKNIARHTGHIVVFKMTMSQALAFVMLMATRKDFGLPSIHPVVQLKAILHQKLS